MKRLSVFMLAACVFSVMSQNWALADQFEGNIAQMDDKAKKITISMMDPGTNKAAEVTVFYNDDTAYEGSADFSKLESGDLVVIEADQDASGNLVASSIELLA